MSANSIVPVSALSGSFFTATLAQNAGLAARILLPEAIGAGRNGMSIIRSIQVTSADQNDWEFWFWSNQGQQQGGHPDLEGLLGFWSFTVAGGDGKRIGGAGNYYYYIDGLSIPYHDDDAHNQPSLGTFLNVTLVNRSAGAKTVNAWFQAVFGLEPTLGS